MVGIAQLVRAPDCGSGGREFESHYPPHIKYDSLAQSVEHLTFNQGVPSSNLGWVTIQDTGGCGGMADAADLGSVA